MAGFLESAGVRRPALLQADQRFQRVARLLQVALCNGEQVKRVRIVRIRFQRLPRSSGGRARPPRGEQAFRGIDA